MGQCQYFNFQRDEWKNMRHSSHMPNAKCRWKECHYVNTELAFSGHFLSGLIFHVYFMANLSKQYLTTFQEISWPLIQNYLRSDSKYLEGRGIPSQCAESPVGQEIFMGKEGSGWCTGSQVWQVLFTGMTKTLLRLLSQWLLPRPSIPSRPCRPCVLGSLVYLIWQINSIPSNRLKSWKLN